MGNAIPYPDRNTISTTAMLPLFGQAVGNILSLFEEGTMNTVIRIIGALLIIAAVVIIRKSKRKEFDAANYLDMRGVEFKVLEDDK